MTRVSSSRSNGSSLSLTSHMSHMDVGGNAPGLRTVPQESSALRGTDPCLLLDSHASADSTQLYWPDCSMDMGMDADSAYFALENTNSLQHVIPAQIHLGSGAQALDNSSPSSWDQFSNTLSRTPSPVKAEDPYVPLLSPDTSPELPCQSPWYVRNEHYEFGRRPLIVLLCLVSQAARKGKSLFFQGTCQGPRSPG